MKVDTQQLNVPLSIIANICLIVIGKYWKLVYTPPTSYIYKNRGSTLLYITYINMDVYHEFAY